MDPVLIRGRGLFPQVITFPKMALYGKVHSHEVS